MLKSRGVEERIREARSPLILINFDGIHLDDHHRLDLHVLRCKDGMWIFFWRDDLVLVLKNIKGTTSKQLRGHQAASLVLVKSY